jgi:NAD-dependent DNA ligase
MTGFRDKDLESKLKSLGAKISSSVSKNTYLVLVKTMDEDTGKVADARKLGINIMTPAIFRDKFQIFENLGSQNTI